MFGIVGQVKNEGVIEESLFNKMRDTLVHKRPDGFGTQFLAGNKIAFGHRRLSIIDLSESGKQPMSIDNGQYCITYNGEIYNFKILKFELEKRGVEFQPHSDTEVLLQGYKAWGIEKLLAKVKGMFAFVIYDLSKNIFVMARNRFGMKPFYYYNSKEQFVFASEIKAIIRDPSVKRTISNKSLADYFIYGYVPNPKTIWKEVNKLEPAHYGVFDLSSKNLTFSKYWDLNTSANKIERSQAVKEVNEIINNAVKEHLVSDVDVGLFLSGGYDSSSLLMHAKDLNYNPRSFSIGFEGLKRSEHHVARKIADNFASEFFELLLKPNENFLEDLRELSYYYDDPFAVSSLLPYYYVYQLAATRNKVVLVGDGGDEALAGYKWYNKLYEEFGESKQEMIKNENTIN